MPMTRWHSGAKNGTICGMDMSKQVVASPMPRPSSIFTVEGVKIDGIHACLPARSVDNLDTLSKITATPERAKEIVSALGIVSRRVAEEGESALSLSVKAAKSLLADTKTPISEVGAVIFVTFTPDRQMPCNACQAQKLLDLEENIIAFDVNLACSGYLYGLYLSSLLAKSTMRKVLLLDGDVQTPRVRPDDEATVPVMADAGTATLVSPASSPSVPWRFRFLSDGAHGEALTLPHDGHISMDGFAVFSFVSTKVSALIKAFLAETGTSEANYAAFVPHQANMYMIRQLARTIGFPREKLLLSGDAIGNSASATVPATIVWCGARGRLLASGFGGGLSVAVADISIPESSSLKIV